MMTRLPKLDKNLFNIITSLQRAHGHPDGRASSTSSNCMPLFGAVPTRKKQFGNSDQIFVRL